LECIQIWRCMLSSCRMILIAILYQADYSLGTTVGRLNAARAFLIQDKTYMFCPLELTHRQSLNIYAA
jgi:hypothetical protein